VQIGEKTSEQLEYRAAKLVVVVHHRAVYGLSEEDRVERKIEPVVAPGPVQPIEDARVGASLLACMLVVTVTPPPPGRRRPGGGGVTVTIHRTDPRSVMTSRRGSPGPLRSPYGIPTRPGR